MNVIRVTKTARNRVDVVFTGDKLPYVVSVKLEKR